MPSQSNIGLALIMALVAGCGDDTQNTGGSSEGGGGSTSSNPTNGGGPSAGGNGDGGAADGGNGTGGSGGEPLGAGLPGGPSSDRLTVKPLGTVDGAAQGYWEYLPPGYGNGAAYPLLMFYHGIGENGDGSEGALQSVLNTGLPALLRTTNGPGRSRS